MNIKNIYLVALLILITNYGISQNLSIQYSVKNNESINQFELRITDTLTFWKYIETAQSSTLSGLFLVKKSSNNTIFFKDILFNKEFFVKDTLHNMKWELTDNTKIILGKNCLSAKTTFRGRDYFAFFTNEIAISDGPWKFGGLPGLILEIKSSDDNYGFTAIKIEQSSETKKYIFDTTNYNFINWNEYVKQFITTIDNTVKLVRTKISKDESGNIKIDGVEIIYPKAQTGKGIEY